MMDWKIEVILYGLLLGTAVLALEMRSLLAAVVTASAYSFFSAMLFIAMGAVDVGFTEAVVGAGLVGVFFLAAIFKTNRRSLD